MRTSGMVTTWAASSSSWMSPRASISASLCRTSSPTRNMRCDGPLAVCAFFACCLGMIDPRKNIGPAAVCAEIRRLMRSLGDGLVQVPRVPKSSQRSAILPLAVDQPQSSSVRLMTSVVKHSIWSSLRMSSYFSKAMPHSWPVCTSFTSSLKRFSVDSLPS